MNPFILSQDTSSLPHHPSKGGTCRKCLWALVRVLGEAGGRPFPHHIQGGWLPPAALWACEGALPLPLLCSHEAALKFPSPDPAFPIYLKMPPESPRATVSSSPTSGMRGFHRGKERLVRKSQQAWIFRPQRGQSWSRHGHHSLTLLPSYLPQPAISLGCQGKALCPEPRHTLRAHSGLWIQGWCDTGGPRMGGSAAPRSLWGGRDSEV